MGPPSVGGPFLAGAAPLGAGGMLTSTECDEMAKQKLVQAEHEPQRRARLLTAAQGWLVLESELMRLEASVIPPKASRSVQADLSRRRTDAVVRRPARKRPPAVKHN